MKQKARLVSDVEFSTCKVFIDDDFSLRAFTTLLGTFFQMEQS